MGLNELLDFKGSTHLIPTQTHSFDSPRYGIPYFSKSNIGTDTDTAKTLKFNTDIVPHTTKYHAN